VTTEIALPLQTLGSCRDSPQKTANGNGLAETPLLLFVTRTVVVSLPILCHIVPLIDKCRSLVYKLPMEIIWMIIDLYPRLDYSYMRSIRAEPSIYNHRFEVLRNLISVSRSFRKTLHNIYWETFEIALTYPRRRLPEPGQLELGAECPRFVSRTSELQGLRKTFWNLRDTASCIRYDPSGFVGLFLSRALICDELCV
jgi:hypothetical protein